MSPKDATPATDGKGAFDCLLAWTGQASYHWNLTTDKLSWSDNFRRLVGLRHVEAAGSGRSYATLLLEEEGRKAFAKVLSCDTRAGPGQPVPYRRIYALAPEHVDAGAPVWLEDTGVWFADGAGNPSHAQGIVRIASEGRRSEDASHAMSEIDDLTKLPNRRHIERRVEQAIKQCMRENGRAAFAVIGIDRMDMINDFHGFDAGDEVLRKAGEAIASRLRSTDIVARFSGAKFAVLLEDCWGGEVYTAGKRLLDSLRQNVIRLPTGPVALTAAIGACELPRHASSAQEAIAGAFCAYREARKDRSCRIALHDPLPQRRLRLQEDAALANEVVHALDHGMLRLAFQPVVRAADRTVAFHEALIRMPRNGGGQIAAAQFVPLAESLGMIAAIDNRAVDLAVDTLRRFPDAHLSVNVSNASAEEPEWLSKLASRLEEVPGAASRLIVEITESHAASDLGEMQKFISILKSIGCRVAIDDFGAGYTSFANLRALPVDIIKVDGSFARDLANDHQNQVFIRSLLDIARTFDVKTVVEWVDKPETAELLTQWGVDYLQGHSFGAATTDCPWQEAAGGHDTPRSAAKRVAA